MQMPLASIPLFRIVPLPTRCVDLISRWILGKTLEEKCQNVAAAPSQAAARLTAPSPALRTTSGAMAGMRSSTSARLVALRGTRSLRSRSRIRIKVWVGMMGLAWRWSYGSSATVEGFLVSAGALGMVVSQGPAARLASPPLPRRRLPPSQGAAPPPPSPRHAPLPRPAGGGRTVDRPRPRPPSASPDLLGGAPAPLPRFAAQCRAPAVRGRLSRGPSRAR